jgi:hypothetical protein
VRFLSVLLIALALPALAEDESAPAPFAPGDRLPALELADQHGETHRLESSVRRVLFTSDMDGGRLVKEALRNDGGARLDGAAAAYVSDVSRMPGPIRRMFAMPAMRRRPYPIWLDTEGEATARFPVEKGKVTLLILADLELREVRHLGSAEEILAALPAPE